MLPKLPSYDSWALCLNGRNSRRPILLLRTLRDNRWTTVAVYYVNEELFKAAGVMERNIVAETWLSSEDLYDHPDWRLGARMLASYAFANTTGRGSSHLFLDSEEGWETLDG